MVRASSVTARHGSMGGKWRCFFIFAACAFAFALAITFFCDLAFPNEAYAENEESAMEVGITTSAEGDAPATAEGVPVSDGDGGDASEPGVSHEGNEPGEHGSLHEPVGAPDEQGSGSFESAPAACCECGQGALAAESPAAQAGEPSTSSAQGSSDEPEETRDVAAEEAAHAGSAAGASSVSDERPSELPSVLAVKDADTGVSRTAGTANAASSAMKAASASTSSDAKTTKLAFEGAVCTIASIRAKSKVIDVAGGSSKAGAAAQLFGANQTPSQRWVFKLADDGRYLVVNVKSGMALTVKGGKAVNGARVQQGKIGSALAQKWNVVKTGTGSYRIVSALAPSYALGIGGGKAKNGAALLLSKANSLKSQQWVIGEVGQPVADGFFTVESKRSGKVLDVAEGSLKNGANIQQYQSNGTFAQVFSAEYDSATGYYVLRNVATCKVLDARGTKQGANVRQRVFNGSNAQKWSIVANKDGSYSVFSAASGLVLDVDNGSKANGANIQLYTSNGTAAQKWKFKKVSSLLKEGTYLLTTASGTTKAVSVKSNARKSGASVIAAKRTSSNGQLWYLRPKGSGAYTLQNPYSGLYLNAGSAAGSTARLGSEHQEWLVTFTQEGFSLRLEAAKGVALSSAVAAKAPLKTAKARSAKSQRFLLSQRSLVAEGVYVIHSAKSWGKVLDVEDASTDNRANVQLYKSNGSVAQKWDIRQYADGTYFVANVESERVLDIENGSKSSGANVWMYGRNKTSAQRWRLVLDEDTGALSFVSKSNRKLAIGLAGDSAENGANVSVSTNKGAASQQWRLSMATYKPSNRWDKLKRKYLYDDGVGQIIFVKYTGGTGADAELYVKEDNVWERKVSCRANVGARGVGETEEGLWRTPSGNFAITGAFGILSNPGTAGMDYLKVTSAYYWCGDSHYYNQLVDINEKPHNCLGEHLIDYPGAYDYGLFFDYNTNPIRLGKGSAFFFHCSTSTPYTAGCVAVSKDNMVAILSYMQDGARLCIYDK